MYVTVQYFLSSSPKEQHQPIPPYRFAPNPPRPARPSSPGTWPLYTIPPSLPLSFSPFVREASLTPPLKCSNAYVHNDPIPPLLPVLLAPFPSSPPLPLPFPPMPLPPSLPPSSSPLTPCSNNRGSRWKRRRLFASTPTPTSLALRSGSSPHLVLLLLLPLLFLLPTACTTTLASQPILASILEVMSSFLSLPIPNGH